MDQFIKTFIENGGDEDNIIRPDIKDYYDKQSCCVCGKYGNVETVFKNDLFNDERLFYHNSQRMDDFMSLCSSCIDTQIYAHQIEYETGQLYSIRNIKSLEPFVQFMDWNDSAYFDINDIEAKINSYWYDPVAFMNRISNNINRTLDYKSYEKSKLQQENFKLQEEREDLLDQLNQTN